MQWFYRQSKDTKFQLYDVLVRHDINLIFVNTFLGLQAGNKEKNMVFTAYSGLFSYNLGPNYL